MLHRPVILTGINRPMVYTGLDERDARFSRKLNLAPVVDGLKGSKPNLKVITDYGRLFKPAKV